MKTCFFHVGMPKTGSSSIQAALYYAFNDRRFQYVSFGEVNGSRGTVTLFGEKPETHLGNRRLAITGDSLNRYHRRLERRLQRAIRRARRLGADLIISAEDAWHMSAPALTQLRNFFDREGYLVRVIVYLRPWLSWLTSSMQEQLKYGLADLSSAVKSDKLLRRFDYVNRLGKFTQVFGADRVECHPYLFDSLQGGCVVRDFFRRIGSDACRPPAGNLNPSLGVEACKLLYHYNRHRLQSKPGRIFFATHTRLLDRLAGLGGAPMRLHPSIVQPVATFLEEQHHLLLSRHGISLPLDLDPVPEGSCIRDERDLLTPLPSTIEWLARKSKIRLPSAETAADQSRRIAEMVAMLARRFGFLDYGQWIGHALQREWRHVTTAA